MPSAGVTPPTVEDRKYPCLRQRSDDASVREQTSAAYNTAHRDRSSSVADVRGRLRLTSTRRLPSRSRVLESADAWPLACTSVLTTRCRLPQLAIRVVATDESRWPLCFCACVPRPQPRKAASRGCP